MTLRVHFLPLSSLPHAIEIAAWFGSAELYVRPAERFLYSSPDGSVEVYGSPGGETVVVASVLVPLARQLCSSLGFVDLLRSV